MTKLYVANTTKQVQQFHYWVGETQRPLVQEIPVGGQILVYKADAQRHELEKIIEQHERYGLVNVNEIDRTKAFIGCCYRYDEPVDIEKIMRAITHNDEVLQERGVESRKNSVAALDGTLRGSAGNDLMNLETEVTEIAPKGSDNDTMKENIAIESSKPSRRKK